MSAGREPLKRPGSRRRSIAEAMAGTQIEAALERRTIELESKMEDTFSRLGILESREADLVHFNQLQMVFEAHGWHDLDKGRFSTPNKDAEPAKPEPQANSEPEPKPKPEPEPQRGRADDQPKAAINHDLRRQFHDAGRRVLQKLRVARAFKQTLLDTVQDEKRDEEMQKQSKAIANLLQKKREQKENKAQEGKRAQEESAVKKAGDTSETFDAEKKEQKAEIPIRVSAEQEHIMAEDVAAAQRFELNKSSIAEQAAQRIQAAASKAGLNDGGHSSSAPSREPRATASAPLSSVSMERMRAALRSEAGSDAGLSIARRDSQEGENSMPELHAALAAQVHWLMEQMVNTRQMLNATNVYVASIHTPSVEDYRAIQELPEQTEELQQLVDTLTLRIKRMEDNAEEARQDASAPVQASTLTPNVTPVPTPVVAPAPVAASVPLSGEVDTARIGTPPPRGWTARSAAENKPAIIGTSEDAPVAESLSTAPVFVDGESDSAKAPPASNGAVVPQAMRSAISELSAKVAELSTQTHMVRKHNQNENAALSSTVAQIEEQVHGLAHDFEKASFTTANMVRELELLREGQAQSRKESRALKESLEEIRTPVMKELLNLREENNALLAALDRNQSQYRALFGKFQELSEFLRKQTLHRGPVSSARLSPSQPQSRSPLHSPGSAMWGSAASPLGRGLPPVKRNMR